MYSFHKDNIQTFDNPTLLKSKHREIF